MQRAISCALVAVALNIPAAIAKEAQNLVNPAIDRTGYLQSAKLATDHRESRRVSEQEFIRLSRLPGTVILDARSRQRFDLLHIRGAINLSFPDITVESLARLLPDKDTVILIYCNNNFANAPDPFPSKVARAALNLATYTTLYSYGYRNVYELGPLLDVSSSRLTFETKKR